MRMMILGLAAGLALALPVAATEPAALPDPGDRVRLTLDASEAEAVLAILDQRARQEGAEIDEAAWRRLLASEPYVRLKQRETKIADQFHDAGRVFTDEDFRKFVLSPDLLARRAALRETLERWKKADLRQAAAKVLEYLPAGAVIRAKVYPSIKPRTNSFVWDLSTDPAIFLYLDPDVSAAKFENTVAHELHHIGFASVASGYDEKIASLPERPRKAAEVMGAFGEGIAMLAAAGGPDVDPHAASSDRDRAEWNAGMAGFDRDLRALDDFFMNILTGRIAGDDAIGAKASTFFGTHGPWYTVGYRMAVMVEKRFGRRALIDAMLDRRQLLALYNQAAAAANAGQAGKAGAGGPLPLWSDELLTQVGATSRP